MGKTEELRDLIEEAKDFTERMTGQPWACELIERLVEALAARRSSSDEAEVVAWMIPGNGSITTERRTATAWEKDFGCTVQPLVVASPSGVKAGVTEERIVAALNAWRPIMGLIDGQYLPVTRYDKAPDGSVTDILIPFGDTMMEAMCAALTAALGVGDEGMGEADADGWIAWFGGEPPAADDVRVDVRLRCGEDFSGERVGMYRWDFNADLSGLDIIAYRLPHPIQGDAK